MSKVVMLIYGAGRYALFSLTFLYAIGFLGNVLVPKSLDSGPAGPVGTTLLIDLGLLTLFALQHSVMARRVFKRLLTRLASSAVLLQVYVFAALGTVALGAVGTLAIHFGVRTVPACATQPQRAKGAWT